MIDDDDVTSGMKNGKRIEGGNEVSGMREDAKSKRAVGDDGLCVLVIESWFPAYPVLGGISSDGCC